MEITHDEYILLRNPINIEMKKETSSLSYLIVLELLRKFWLYLNGLTRLAVHGMVILLNALVFVMPPISVFQGAAFCRFSSSRALPGNVQSAVAVFELNLGTVEVRRFGEDSLIGERIPRMLILTAYTVVGRKSGEGGKYFVELRSLIVRVGIGPNIPQEQIKF